MMAFALYIVLKPRECDDKDLTCNVSHRSCTALPAQWC